MYVEFSFSFRQNTSKNFNSSPSPTERYDYEDEKRLINCHNVVQHASCICQLEMFQQINLIIFLKTNTRKKR